MIPPQGGSATGIATSIPNAEAWVVLSDAPLVDRQMAAIMQPVFGSLIQICDGTDDDVQLNDAIAAITKGKVKVSGGTAHYTGTIHGKSDVTMELSPGTVLDATGNGAGFRVIEALGSIAGEVNLNADAAIGDNHVHIANTSGFAVGDLILVRSHATWKSNPVGQWQGELQWVGSITANVSLNFLPQGRLVDAYTMANTAAVQKITPINNFRVIGNGGKIKGLAGTLMQGVALSYVTNCEVEGINFEAVEDWCVRLFDANYGANIHDNYIYGQTIDGNSYGIDIEFASQGIEVHHNTGRHCRHVVTTGGGAGLPGIPRNIIISNNNAFDCSEYAFDTHAPGEAITIIGNNAWGCKGGVQFRAYSGEIADNLIIGSSERGIYTESTWTTGSLVIANNRIKQAGDDGIYVTHQGTIISGNSITESVASAYAIHLISAANSLIANNYINQPVGGHIRIESGNNVTVEGNKTFGAANFSLYIDAGVTGTNLQGNNFNDAPVSNGGTGTVMANTSYNNASTNSQSIPATTRTYITGSKVIVPSSGLVAGTILRWHFNMTKTGAGSAPSTVDIAFGTNGTVSDTARVSFTKPAGTGVIDEAWVEVEAIVRSVGASGVVEGEFRLGHNLSATGHATIPFVAVNTVSGGFDDRYSACSYIGLCITTGASDAITIQQCTAEVVGM